MDGMIFLRGVFIDRSVKNVTLYVEDSANRITVINNISSIKDVDDCLKSHSACKITINKVIFDKASGTAKVYCNFA